MTEYVWLQLNRNISEISFFDSHVRSIVGISSFFLNKGKNWNILCICVLMKSHLDSWIAHVLNIFSSLSLRLQLYFAMRLQWILHNLCLSLARFPLLVFPVESFLHIKSQPLFPFWACLLLLYFLMMFSPQGNHSYLGGENKSWIWGRLAQLFWVQLALFPTHSGVLKYRNKNTQSSQSPVRTRWMIYSVRAQCGMRV